MALPTASDNLWPKLILVEGTTPASPSAGDQKLFIDSADHKLKRVDSSGTVTTIEAGGGGTYTAPAAPVVVQRNNGADYTTSSSTFVNIDGTNLLGTLTFTGTHHCRISMGCSVYVANTNAAVVLAVNDGTSDITLGYVQCAAINDPRPFGVSMILPSTYAAGSHTFTARWKTIGTTGTIQCATADRLFQLSVEELPY